MGSVGNEILSLLSKRCVWQIINELRETRCGILNITALVNRLNANYEYVVNCVKLLERYGIVESVKVGRLRLVKLNTNNETCRLMIAVMDAISSSRRIATT